MKEQGEEEVAKVSDSPVSSASLELNRRMEADTASGVARKAVGNEKWSGETSMMV
jgi:hypothetical protein